jgi:hypothetical protein
VKREIQRKPQAQRHRERSIAPTLHAPTRSHGWPALKMQPGFVVDTEKIKGKRTPVDTRPSLAARRPRRHGNELQFHDWQEETEHFAPSLSTRRGNCPAGYPPQRHRPHMECGGKTPQMECVARVRFPMQRHTQSLLAA